MFQKLIRTVFADDGEACQRILDDARFAHNADRVEHRSELIGLIQQEFRKKTRDEWLQRLEGQGFSFGPVNRLDQVFTDPRILSRNVMEVQDELQQQRIKLLRNAVTFISESPYFRSNVRMPPQKIGQDTEQILNSLLNMSQHEMQDLKDRKVIFIP